MFELSDLKKTRFYQEAKEDGRQEAIQEAKQEGKLEVVPFALSLGATVEQIAEGLNLDIEQVRKVAQSHQP
ncbi:hypothetical protein [Nostoc sp. CMAA1605]|uniref:hypothetical protein n=1 Tax=Nostoc sp. CMAA1605 TaxID=2055159 RepID=UPI001F33CE85|nr:hypothetical protein [Nostoc sp. CMAA1605]MCF4969696.1 hypothetical protein [Nostoc sp. CMAA1605]